MSKLFTILVILCMSTTVFAGSVSLQWDAILDPAVTKVIVYQSKSATAPLPWTPVSTVLMPLNKVTVPNIYSGTVLFYVTALNGTLESGPSNIVNVDMPLEVPGFLKAARTP